MEADIESSVGVNFAALVQ